MEQVLRRSVNEYEAQGDFNALSFFVRNSILNMVNVAIPVRVDSVERRGTQGGGLYLSATPLIQQRDASGNALANVTIPKLRYFRLQHGTAAVLCDPKPGDVGLAVFAHQDVSGLNGENTPKPPSSFRAFDVSDGFYFGGFWGKNPTTFIRIEDSGDVVVTAPQSVTVNTTTATVNASSSVTLNAPTTSITGDVSIAKNLTVGGTATISGGVTGEGVNLAHHVHGGVSPGTSTTGEPA